MGAAEEQRLDFMTKIQETKIDLNKSVSKLEELRQFRVEEVELEKLQLESAEKDLENAKALLDMSYKNYEKSVKNKTNTSEDLQRCKDLENTVIHCQKEVEQNKADIVSNYSLRVEQDAQLLSDCKSLKEANETVIK